MLLPSVSRAKEAKRRKINRGEHHPALPHAEIQEFVKSVCDRQTITTRALEFLILTATRTNETREAMWNEFDLDNQLWTIPKERMKAGREHRVPLSAPAIRLFEIQKELNFFNSPYVFFGAKFQEPLGESTLAMCIRRSCYSGKDVSVHGFRSTFRQWGADQKTRFSRNALEAALAHMSGKVERAYQRSDLLEERREIADAWAEYIYKSATVIELNRATR